MNRGPWSESPIHGSRFTSPPWILGYIVHPIPDSPLPTLDSPFSTPYSPFMRVFLVSHFHWDREWYRTMQAFRARLVDAMDMVLDLAASDPGYRFLLDGQTIVLEDYLEVRPEREVELRRHIAAGRLGIGPWYVQPDSLLPSGESHVRNLLLGRHVGTRFGPLSSVAYVPDSFGHPAELPEIFRGFGLDGFVYWRGNDGEVASLGPRWCWRAPSGAAVRALHLTEGYFSAGRPEADVAIAVDRLESVVRKLANAGETPIVLMNGFDHTRPDVHTKALAEALAARIGCTVERALLDDVVAAAPAAGELSVHEGDLVGARQANLLAGTWSARMPLKIRNREIEALLQSWTEPWAALGTALGVADERPALRLAWRDLVQNQAHDSICGCSIDATHDRMAARYDDAEELAEETTQRVLERLAGRPADRSIPDTPSQRVTVFNPSPHVRTDRVRIPLDGEPSLTISLGEPRLHPLTVAALGDQGYEVDGQPARVVVSEDSRRVRWIPNQRAVDLEIVAADLPPFGCRTYTVTPAHSAPETVDDGRVISTDELRVEVEDDGTVTLCQSGRELRGLFDLEDIGDRGDSYDHDPLGAPLRPRLRSLEATRRRHPSGIQSLLVRRVVEVPAGIEADRARRAEETVALDLVVELDIAPGVPRLEARVRLVNRARDHRLRILFPSGDRAQQYSHAAALGVRRSTFTRRADDGWVHPAPATFCHQGWVEANGLTLVAPGLPEAEVTGDGAIALTLVRSVGWLARYDLRSRALPAGPAMEAPGAQVLGDVETRLALFCGGSESDRVRIAQEASAPLRGVIAGPSPLLRDDHSLLSLDGDGIVLSALKPANDGNGIVLRLLNTTNAARRATVRAGFSVAAVGALRLDETADDTPLEWNAATSTAQAELGAYGLLTIRLAVR